MAMMSRSVISALSDMACSKPDSREMFSLNAFDKVKQMDSNSRVSKAKEQLMNETCIDRIYEIVAAPDYVEFRGSVGSDVVCF